MLQKYYYLLFHLNIFQEDVWESEESKSDPDSDVEEIKDDKSDLSYKPKITGISTRGKSRTASPVPVVTIPEEFEISSRGRILKRRVIPNNVEDQGLKKRRVLRDVSPTSLASVKKDLKKAIKSSPLTPAAMAEASTLTTAELLKHLQNQQKKLGVPTTVSMFTSGGKTFLITAPIQGHKQFVIQNKTTEEQKLRALMHPGLLSDSSVMSTAQSSLSTTTQLTTAQHITSPSSHTSTKPGVAAITDLLLSKQQGTVRPDLTMPMKSTVLSNNQKEEIPHTIPATGNHVLLSKPGDSIQVRSLSSIPQRIDPAALQQILTQQTLQQLQNGAIIRTVLPTNLIQTKTTFDSSVTNTTSYATLSTTPSLSTCNMSSVQHTPQKVKIEPSTQTNDMVPQQSIVQNDTPVDMTKTVAPEIPIIEPVLSNKLSSVDQTTKEVKDSSTSVRQLPESLVTPKSKRQYKRKQQSGLSTNIKYANNITVKELLGRRVSSQPEIIEPVSPVKSESFVPTFTTLPKLLPMPPHLKASVVQPQLNILTASTTQKNAHMNFTEPATNIFRVSTSSLSNLPVKTKDNTTLINNPVSVDKVTNDPVVNSNIEKAVQSVITGVPTTLPTMNMKVLSAPYGSTEQRPVTVQTMANKSPIVAHPNLQALITSTSNTQLVTQSNINTHHSTNAQNVVRTVLAVPSAPVPVRGQTQRVFLRVVRGSHTGQILQTNQIVPANPLLQNNPIVQGGSRLLQPGGQILQTGVQVVQTRGQVVRPVTHIVRSPNVQPTGHIIQASGQIQLSQPGIQIARPGTQISQPGIPKVEPSGQIIQTTGNRLIQPGTQIIRAGSQIFQPGTQLVRSSTKIVQANLLNRADGSVVRPTLQSNVVLGTSTKANVLSPPPGLRMSRPRLNPKLLNSMPVLTQKLMMPPSPQNNINPVSIKSPAGPTQVTLMNDSLSSTTSTMNNVVSTQSPTIISTVKQETNSSRPTQQELEAIAVNALTSGFLPEDKSKTKSPLAVPPTVVPSNSTPKVVPTGFVSTNLVPTNIVRPNIVPPKCDPVTGQPQKTVLLRLAVPAGTNINKLLQTTQIQNLQQQLSAQMKDQKATLNTDVNLVSSQTPVLPLHSKPAQMATALRHSIGNPLVATHISTKSPSEVPKVFISVNSPLNPSQQYLIGNPLVPLGGARPVNVARVNTTQASQHRPIMHKEPPKTTKKYRSKSRPPTVAQLRQMQDEMRKNGGVKSSESNIPSTNVSVATCVSVSTNASMTSLATLKSTASTTTTPSKTDYIEQPSRTVVKEELNVVPNQTGNGSRVAIALPTELPSTTTTSNVPDNTIVKHVITKDGKSHIVRLPVQCSTTPASIKEEPKT